MKLSTHLKIAFRTLDRIKFKVLVVVLAFVLGTAALYALLFLSQVVSQETARRFYSEGYDIFTILKKNDAGDWAPGQIRPLDYRVADFFKKEPTYVIAVAPEIRVERSINFHQQDFSVPTIGVLEDYGMVHGLKVKYGRFFTRLDSTKSFCVLGHALYERLKTSPTDSLLGARLYIGQQLVEVIGVLEKSPSLQRDYSIDETLLVPLRTLQQFLLKPDLTRITVKANPNIQLPDVIGYLEKALALYLGDASNYEVSNQRLFLRLISDRVKRISTYLGVIGLLALLVGSWALLRVTCLSILRRRREVSFVQNFDMQDKILSFQLFIEVILPVIAAGLVGVGLGILTTLLIARMNNWVFFVPHLAWAFAFGFTFILGIFIGWYPTYKTIYSARNQKP